MRNIETIKDFRGIDQAASLKLIMEDLEQDVGEQHYLNSSDLILFVKEEVQRLSEHMQKTYVETQHELEAESQELKSLEAENIKIVDAINASNNELADANEQLEKAEAMIKGPTSYIQSWASACGEDCQARTAECLKRSDPQAKKKAVIAEAQARLAQLAAVNHENLKSQALARAEENRKQKLSFLEINSYHMRDQFNISSTYLFFLNK